MRTKFIQGYAAEWFMVQLELTLRDLSLEGYCYKVEVHISQGDKSLFFAVIRYRKGLKYYWCKLKLLFTYK